MDPLISIIVPVYNVEKYLKNCLDSIVNQTYHNLEIIIINDGSTDGSHAIIQDYLSDNRIVYINKVNSGQSICREIGFDKCNGDFVYFLDSDDVLEMDAIQVMYHEIERTSADYCCCGYRLVDANHKLIKNCVNYGELLESNEDIIKDAFQTRNIKSTLWTKLFRKSFMIKNGVRPFSQISIHDDCVLSYVSSIYANKVCFVKKPLYNVLQHSESISRRVNPQTILVYEDIFKIISIELQNQNKYNIYINWYCYAFIKSYLYSIILCGKKLRFKDFVSIYRQIPKESLFYKFSIIRRCLKVDVRLGILALVSWQPHIIYIFCKLYKNFQH